MLARDGNVCVHSVGAGEQWTHGCVLIRWVLVSNGDMGVCWIGVGEEWRWSVHWVNSNQQ